MKILKLQSSKYHLRGNTKNMTSSIMFTKNNTTNYHGDFMTRNLLELLMRDSVEKNYINLSQQS